MEQLPSPWSPGYARAYYDAWGPTLFTGWTVAAVLWTLAATGGSPLEWTAGGIVAGLTSIGTGSWGSAARRAPKSAGFRQRYHWRVANNIATRMAATPGLEGLAMDTWFAMSAASTNGYTERPMDHTWDRLRREAINLCDEAERDDVRMLDAHRTIEMLASFRQELSEHYPS